MPENTSNSTDFKSRYPDSTDCDANLAVKFLTQIAKGGRVVVVAVPVNSKASPRTWAYDMADPNEVEELRSFMRYNETQPHNMFYAPNRTAHWKTPTPPDNTDIDQVRHIVLDFDPSKEATARGEIEQERMRLRTVAYGLINGPVQPRTIVDTGGGMQVVFELEPPLAIDIEAPYAQHKAAYESVATLMRDLSRALGAETHTCTVKNLFRIPGTKNWPTAAKKKAGREISFSGLWFTGGPRTTLDELRSLTLREGGPADQTTSDGPGIDLGEVDEDALIEVLAKPDKLPQRLRALVATNNALAEAVKHPIKPDDTSAYDHHLCKTMVSLSIPAGDMALILVAYSEKAKTTHYQQNRLFSYIRTTIGKAISEDPVNLLDPANFDEELAAKEREQAEEKAQQKFDRFRPMLMAELRATAGQHQDQLIDGLMPRRAVTVIYGESGAGKTFVALDLAYRVSMGMEWCGRLTTKCAVIYVAAESPASVARRLIALGDTYGDSASFYVVQAAPNMSDPKAEDLDALGKQIAALKIDVGMIVIDTLARTMVGNENSTQDMGQLVRNGDLLREAFRANVVWVHHSGKDRSLGARGSSALRAATDTEIEIHDNWFDVTKSRDEGAFRHKFALKTGLIVGKKKSGAPITTCIVQWADGPSATGGKGSVEMTRRDSVLYILRGNNKQPMTVGDIHTAAELAGIKLGTRNGTQMMLTRACEDETQRIFRVMGEKSSGVQKNSAKLYGLWEW